ncbi:hypothetical protein CS022_11920 [Veronia nyctiphanis]|uniref:Conjugal transfer protein TraF n=1 Tax=Veronia nyctiphanis TaxID=1278244 RepID=A0A4Q0YSA8_9GAMM|nr:conjugal transfer protein TraF [Veronia nyctiphanis]RXJ73004.1 hypothetical protein CS022_11920 [Veronia nyctiphanis]
MKKTQLAAALSLSAISLPTLAMVGTDARSAGMGGTGVASADHITAPFYNPAQMKKFEANDDFGLLLPSAFVGANTTEDLDSKIDQFQLANKELKSAQQAAVPNAARLEAAADNWKVKLKGLDNSGFSMGLGVNFAVAIPNSLMPVNVFSKNDVHTEFLIDIDTEQLDKDDDQLDAGTSNVQLVAGSVSDIGVSVARDVLVPYVNETISLGFSPKIQRLTVYNAFENLDTFDNDSYELSSEYQQKTTFNVDFGASYRPITPVTVALSATNLIPQELDSLNDNGSVATFRVEPSVTAGAAYDNGWLLAAADIDLTEKRLFKDVTKGEQYARLGVEFDALNWAQLRAGYSISMVDGSEDLVTLGVGFSPFGVLGVDVATQVAGDNEFHVAAELRLSL